MPVRLCFQHVAWLGYLLATLSARAIIISGGDGGGNTNAPVDDPGWDNIGRLQSVPSSVTYLGSNWFLTAYHVQYYDQPTGVLLHGSTYAVDTSSWQRLSYAGTNADLAMFRVTTAVTGLPTLTLRSSVLAEGSAVTMIGDGRDRQGDLTCWNSAWQVTNSAAGVYSGYYWAASAGTKRWGENTTDFSGWVDDGFGSTYAFRTTFDANGGASEAQGAIYDSGGGVFYKNGANWELAGLMLTIDEYAGQPLESAVFGNTTFMADLAPYHDQIVGIMAIPEPSGIFVMGLGALLIARRFHRWRT